MDSRATKAQSAPKRAWARTGALILFIVTGVLLIASLHGVRSEPARKGALQFDAGEAAYSYR